MIEENPDFKWYANRSREAHSSPRCPIGSAELCPRYYASFELLGRQGVTTTISEVDQHRLEKKWKPFGPVVAEEDVGISLDDGKVVSVSGLCPEVGFQAFGYFATGLYRYADELDRDIASEMLSRNGVDASDFRWQWSMLVPRHYTECREYSLYMDVTSGKRRRTPKVRNALSPRLRWQILARDSFTCQYCGRRPPDVSLEVDHRTSVVEGGTEEPDNLIAACTECNRGKGRLCSTIEPRLKQE